MKNYLFLLIAIIITLSACNEYPNFQVLEDNCEFIRLKLKDKTIDLKKDTAWYVSINDTKLFYADKNKISAFFNVLRDIEVQGLSTHNSESDFEYTIEVLKPNGNVKTTLKFNSVPSSSTMIGSCDNSKCYVVGVPGLNESPSINFTATPEYWKNLSLIDISAQSLSQLSIKNYIEPNQSFSVSLNVDSFVVKNNENQFELIPQQNIKMWLGSLSTYSATEYYNSLEINDSLKIYDLYLKTKYGSETTISFYKKIDKNNQPDFHKMYFSSNGEFGTVKYFDFDRLLIDLKDLKD
ncbi:MAG: hypothetical protein MJ211_13935 [Bacteroidales bacterium]|nr:hypothetical protein [Bacteroidales bacterium]